MDAWILPMIIFLLETGRYCICADIFFHIKTRRLWVLPIGICLYLLWMWQTGQSALLFAYLFAFGIAFFVIKEKIGRKLYVMSVIFCMTAIMDEVFGNLLEYIDVIERLQIREVLEEILILIVVILYKQLERKHVINGSRISKWVKEGVLLFIILMVSFVVLMINSLSYMERFASDAISQHYIQAISIIAPAVMLCVIIFTIYIRRTNEEMRKSILKEQQLKTMQEKYYQSLLDREEDTRRYRHDMHNHLLCLKTYAEEGKNELLLKYIENLQEQMNVIQRKCFYTGNHLLDILLNQYLYSLENVKVTVWGMCREDIAISEIDFCTIFSNLIENAAEEMERQETSESKIEKYVKVFIKQGTEDCIIEIRNSMQQNEENQEAFIEA